MSDRDIEIEVEETIKEVGVQIMRLLALEKYEDAVLINSWIWPIQKKCAQILEENLKRKFAK